MIAVAIVGLMALLAALLVRRIASAPLLATLAICFDNSADDWRQSNRPDA